MSWQGEGNWQGWHAFQSNLTTTPVVGQNSDGRLELFARGSGGELLHAWQHAPSSGWSEWQALPGASLLGDSEWTSQKTPVCVKKITSTSNRASPHLLTAPVI
jgi:hypothetical protein